MHYRLYVTVSNDGLVRDSGLHDEGDYLSDEEAIRELKKSAESLTILFDRVQIRILEGEREVHKGYLDDDLFAALAARSNSALDLYVSLFAEPRNGSV